MSSPNSKDKKQRIKSIGRPENFCHVLHVGHPDETEIDWDDPELSVFLNNAEVTLEELQNQEVRKVILKFIRYHGMNSIRREVRSRTSESSDTGTPSRPSSECSDTMSFHQRTSDVFEAVNPAIKSESSELTGRTSESIDENITTQLEFVLASSPTKGISEFADRKSPTGKAGLTDGKSPTGKSKLTDRKSPPGKSELTDRKSPTARPELTDRKSPIQKPPESSEARNFTFSVSEDDAQSNLYHEIPVNVTGSGEVWRRRQDDSSKTSNGRRFRKVSPKTRKLDIQLGNDFRRISHVSWDPKKGFVVDAIEDDPVFTNFLIKAGLQPAEKKTDLTEDNNEKSSCPPLPPRYPRPRLVPEDKGSKVDHNSQTGADEESAEYEEVIFKDGQMTGCRNSTCSVEYMEILEDDEFKRHSFPLVRRTSSRHRNDRARTVLTYQIPLPKDSAKRYAVMEISASSESLYVAPDPPEGRYYQNVSVTRRQPKRTTYIRTHVQKRGKDDEEHLKFHEVDPDAEEEYVSMDFSLSDVKSTKASDPEETPDVTLRPKPRKRLDGSSHSAGVGLVKADGQGWASSSDSVITVIERSSNGRNRTSQVEEQIMSQEFINKSYMFVVEGAHVEDQVGCTDYGKEWSRTEVLIELPSSVVTERPCTEDIENRPTDVQDMKTAQSLGYTVNFVCRKYIYLQ